MNEERGTRKRPGCLEVLRWLLPRSSFLVPLAVSAQEPVAPTALPPVVVTVTRDIARSPLELPFAITRVAPDSLRPGQRNLAADEALMLIPGVSVANRNNPTQDPRIAVRGFGAARRVRAGHAGPAGRHCNR